ncbi:hypothetical protein Sjap_005306 [Stephania japonica]|uniref:Uncharacterized protein n=1 Tax=Stephania japonica TaxID=461633 RepID=A0AAP0PHR0_9MAGN
MRGILVISLPKMGINTTDTTIFHILINREEKREKPRRGARDREEERWWSRGGEANEGLRRP